MARKATNGKGKGTYKGRTFPNSSWKWVRKYKRPVYDRPVYELFVGDRKYPVARITPEGNRIYGILFHIENSPRGLGEYAVGWRSVASAKDAVETLYNLKKAKKR